MMHWDSDGMMGWGGGLFGGLVTLALVVVGVVALVRMSRGGRLGLGRPSAEQILDERFARGDLDIEEYTQRRNLLRAGRSPSQCERAITQADAGGTSAGRTA
jgi:putative membrane protein